ncbi:GDSL-type esterase/lipase family protein [Paenibacillus sp. MMS18-CY102]|uniref:GDSL-type esterase/lipase family protein n=1 Tax=Paenibacillus sp. MMS18-CY102 TaxID=2682849 RepID=UPI001365EFB3|nr:GDSL-type esterase/lipase family protein [Paenibacillus sp. MMS18-CY102]MWC28089.1 GDSL family lipase [Paenibacillus sp. MMS18-CY102]
MNRGTVLWRVIGIVAVLATILLLAGFAYAVKDMLRPGQAISPIVEDGPSTPSLADQPIIRVTALGDSLTKGTGDSTGEGYVKPTMKHLEEMYGKPVKLLNNLAINGLRADQLNEKLETDKGFQLAVRESDVILMTIGGNDLFAFAAGNEKGVAANQGQLSMDELNANLAIGTKRLEQTLKRLNELNPKAKIVYIGLYNPFYDVKDLREGSLQVQAWNKEVYAIIYRYPNMRLIPTFDLFEANLSKYLSSDHFHPNHEGYAAIASRIAQAIN